MLAVLAVMMPLSTLPWVQGKGDEGPTRVRSTTEALTEMGMGTSRMGRERRWCWW